VPEPSSKPAYSNRPGWAEVKQRWGSQLAVVLPVEIDGPVSFRLLAVWSFNNRGTPLQHSMPGPVHVALDELRDWRGWSVWRHLAGSRKLDRGTHPGSVAQRGRVTMVRSPPLTTRT
jgi:hypothetical protein